MKFEYNIEDLKKKFPELTDELLETLHNWTILHGLPPVPHEKLALFAHSCYFDTDRAIRCMHHFYKLRSTTPEFFRNMDPGHETMQRTFEILCFANLPVLTPEGYRIHLHRLEDTRAEKYIMDDAMKMYIMMLEHAFYTQGCSTGTILLFDANGLRLSHLMRISISSVRKFMEYVQEALPVRMKGIYVVNGVWFMNKVLAILKPFMKQEIYEMIHIYSGDISELYSTIPPKCLPSDYGGELGSVKSFREDLRQNLLDWRDQFLLEESLYRSFIDTDSESFTSKKNSLEYIENQDIRIVHTNDNKAS